MSESSEFSSLKLSTQLLAVIDELGYTSMTPIQAQSIPALLAGRDLVGQSSTGSGKTAAFALPILEKISLDSRHVQALILCPTRELSAQVAREVRKLGRRHAGLHVLVLAGGQFIAPQLGALEKGAHIAVGTPGRIMDIIGRKKLNLAKIKTVVLDEADRMLDMGFEEDMEQILSALPRSRQTVFFSATFPESIKALGERYQKDPVSVVIKDQGPSEANIQQFFVETSSEGRSDTLKRILDRVPLQSAIVFCNLKVAAQELAEFLKAQGLSSDSLHGDLEQFDRDRVLAKFRNRSTKILVATDVAARGIDIEKLDLVVNYDTPAKPDVYVHRIGRTGRAGAVGMAVSLVAARETHKIDRINDYTKANHQLTALNDFLQQIATVDSFEPVKTDAAMGTLCISAGRKDKLRPGDVLGALTGEAGKLEGRDVGKIEIHDRLTYVAVSASVIERACEALLKGKIKGRTIKVTIVS